jgi:hypothetical protein
MCVCVQVRAPRLPCTHHVALCAASSSLGTNPASAPPGPAPPPPAAAPRRAAPPAARPVGHLGSKAAWALKSKAAMLLAAVVRQQGPDSFAALLPQLLSAAAEGPMQARVGWGGGEGGGAARVQGPGRCLPARQAGLRPAPPRPPPRVSTGPRALRRRGPSRPEPGRGSKPRAPPL